MLKKEEQPSASPDGMTRFLWWLAAADIDILNECRTEKERFRIIGISVLVTWIFATLAWGYFFSTILNDDLAIGLLALFFGFAILSIDRTLIAAMSRAQGGIKIMPLIFRLVLAITIGLFVSQPVVLMLFKKDINAQLELSRQTKLDAYRQQLTKLNAIELGKYTQGITEGKQKLADKSEELKVYREAYIHETDGTGGSGRIGESAIAKVKKMAYLKSEEELQAMERSWAPKQRELETQINRLHGEDSLKEAIYLGTLTNGFLAQIEALNELTDTHPPVQQRYRLIVFIIVLIEVMPLLSKVLMPRGEYDEKLAAATTQGAISAQLEADKGEALQQHYQEAALASDKETIDQLFAASSDMRKEQVDELVKEWRNKDDNQYRRFWQQAKKLLIGKM
ncbi:DUF4407 domain-containing protein [Chitinophaga silvatica]|uniref:DUF4407 domain-containing protein n=1 Tax=Chitinophaga silvatica TaxID=2282649 RepID=A0A3E1YEL3_9BACT|nr:DUF4407 domain-containing protein [Chitinophaga silvatica]RFS24985.1 DUF4407 domain-containing protein [Chitinophaga silvatica]